MLITYKSQRIMAEYNNLLNAMPFSLVNIYQPFELNSLLHFHIKVTPKQIFFPHCGNVKVDLFLQQVIKTQRGDETLGFRLYFDIR